MIDPITAIGLTLELTSLLAEIMEFGFSVVEKMRSRRETLLSLLGKSETMRNYLEIFRGMSKSLANDPNTSGISLNFNGEQCKVVITKIKAFVAHLVGNSTIGQWWKNVEWVTRYNSQVEGLLAELTSCEQNLQTVLMLITTQTLISKRPDVDDLKRQIKSEAKPQYALALTQWTVPIWFGDLFDTHHPQAYSRERFKLAEAAFRGRFDVVFEMLAYAESIYHESWVNCTRMKRDSDDPQASHWTPLHHAVYWGLDAEVIKALVKGGAYRTLRTAWSDPRHFDDRDMTALDMARALKRNHLLKDLAPVLYHTVPSDTLNVLETRFRDLIIREPGSDNIRRECINLPQLHVLLELEEPLMHFHAFGKKVYEYRLFKRWLFVKSLVPTSPEMGGHQLWKITEFETAQIDEAIVFGY